MVTIVYNLAEILTTHILFCQTSRKDPSEQHSSYKAQLHRCPREHSPELYRSLTGITSAFDASNGWPFYIMKSVSVEQNSGQKFGTAVERIKLYAETEARRKAIVEIIEECK